MKKLIVLISLLPPLILGGILAYAQKEGFKVVYVKVSEENLRASPNGKKLGTILRGTKLERIGQKGKWAQVRIEAWIWTPSLSEQKPPAERFVTLDGYDAATGITIQKINLWKDYNNRRAGISATAQHGEKVKLIRREGDGVLVETKAGKRGWVTYYFIKEFK